MDIISAFLKPLYYIKISCVICHVLVSPQRRATPERQRDRWNADWPAPRRSAHIIHHQHLDGVLHGQRQSSAGALLRRTEGCVWPRPAPSQL